MMRRSSLFYCAVLCVAAMFCLVLPILSVAQNKVVVIKEMKHDVSLPLSELARMTPAQPNPFSPTIL